MTKTKEFQCTLSTFNKLSTFILSLFPVLFVYISYIEQQVAFVFVAIILVIFLGTCALFSPRKYTIDPKKVTIHRWGPSIDIPLKSIKNVSQISLPRAMRTFGVGGYFGNYGWFYAKKIGSYRAYTTRHLGPLVIFEFESIKPIVLSPDDCDAFLAILNEQIPDKVSTA